MYHNGFGHKFRVDNVHFNQNKLIIPSSIVLDRKQTEILHSTTDI
jgi:hypothetical protein